MYPPPFGHLGRAAARERRNGTLRRPITPQTRDVPLEAAMACLHIDDAMRARHARGE